MCSFPDWSAIYFRLWFALCCFQIMPHHCGCVKNPRTGHSPRLADLESPSGTDMRRVFPSHFISNRLTHPEQNKVKGLTKALFFLPSFLSFRLRSVSNSAWSSLTGEAVVNGWMDGRAGYSITAAAACISIRRQTMWEPMCPRLQMALTGRDGLCDGELHADCTGCDRLGEWQSRLLVGQGQRTVEKETILLLYLWCRRGLWWYFVSFITVPKVM